MQICVVSFAKDGHVIRAAVVECEMFKRSSVTLAVQQAFHVYHGNPMFPQVAHVDVVGPWASDNVLSFVKEPA